LNRLLGGHRLFFKAENLQRAGAFKVGVTMLGVTTFGSVNHCIA
jgi:threonine dehydratase